MKLLTVEILTDDYPSETSWTLTNLCTGELQAKVDPSRKYIEPETLYTDDYCVPDNDYEFTIFDSYGDGLCCNEGMGSYELKQGPINLYTSSGQFGQGEKIEFSVSSVPIPAAIWLFGSAVLGLIGFRKRQAI